MLTKHWLAFFIEISSHFFWVCTTISSWCTDEFLKFVNSEFGGVVVIAPVQFEESHSRESLSDIDPAFEISQVASGVRWCDVEHVPFFPTEPPQLSALVRLERQRVDDPSYRDHRGYDPFIQIQGEAVLLVTVWTLVCSVEDGYSCVVYGANPWKEDWSMKISFLYVYHQNK